jgi:hypothetical protein
MCEKSWAAASHLHPWGVHKPRRVFGSLAYLSGHIFAPRACWSVVARTQLSLIGLILSRHAREFATTQWLPRRMQAVCLELPRSQYHIGCHAVKGRHAYRMHLPAPAKVRPLDTSWLPRQMGCHTTRAVVAPSRHCSFRPSRHTFTNIPCRLSFLYHQHG